MSYLHDKFSNTPKPYKFVLETNLGVVTCNKEPLEWKEGILQLHRDLKTVGIVTSFQVDSLIFVGIGAAKLKECFASLGVTSTVTLHVYYFDNKTKKYIEYPGSFLGIWESYKIVKIGMFAFGVKMEFINSGLYQKFNDRSKINVELQNNRESVGGFVITNDPTEVNDLKFAAINKINLNWLGFDKELLLDDETYNLKNISTADVYASPNMKIQQTDNTGFSSVYWHETTVNPDSISALYTATEDITFKYLGVLRVQIKTSAYLVDHFKLIINIGGTETELLSFGQVENFDTNFYKELSFGFDSVLNATLTAGQTIKIYLKADQQGILELDTEINVLYFYVKFLQTIASVAESNVKGKTLYNAFNKNLQLILDEQSPFKSDYLKLNPMVLASGTNLRGVAVNMYNPNYGSLSVNFDDLFKSANAILNLGYGFEIIDGVEKLVIENYAYFFDKTAVVLDLSDRIGKYDIESEVIGELLYSSYKYGFDKFVYETQNGFGEYNCQHERTSVLATDNVFESICKYRGDTMGIIKQLQNPFSTTGTNDVEGDDDVFIIKVVDKTTYYLAETNEDITIVDDSSLFGDESLNLFMSPMRSLMRHGNKLSSGLVDWQPSSSLRWQKSNKNVGLITSLGGVELSETANIKIQDLSTPIVKPIKHTFTCKFTKTDLATYVAHPYQLVKARDKYGYMLDLKIKNKEDKATIEIIEAVL